MLQAESIKLFIFIGSIVIMLLLAVLMVFSFVIGAEAVGQMLLTANIVMSIAFSLIAGLLGGSERKI